MSSILREADREVADEVSSLDAVYLKCRRTSKSKQEQHGGMRYDRYSVCQRAQIRK